MTGPLYRGYSSVDQKRTSRELVDSELVRQDLLNHLGINLREIPGRPRFGTGISDALADPQDEILEEFILGEVRRVIEQDPRVRPLEVVLDSDIDGQSMTVRAGVLYVELGIEGFLEFTLDPERY